MKKDIAEYLKDLVSCPDDCSNKTAKVALKLGISEAYVRMIVAGKKYPAPRLARDIQELWERMESEKF